MKKTLNNYTLYIEDADRWVKDCQEDCCINEETKVQIIKSGIILPLILPLKNDARNSCGMGGVCDVNGIFVAGHKTWKSQDGPGITVSRAYPIPSEINSSKETVVYGGLVYNHFGHFITECLSRMWWFLENPTCGYKFVFITPENHPDDSRFLEYFLLLGLAKENIIVLRKPTRFDLIIIPDQSIYIHSGYKPNATKIYNVIRKNVPAAGYEKVYFTRTKLHRPDAVNEEYFESYFHSKGYEVIAPEKLSIEEQVAVMAGVKEYACVSGSLHHHILFGRNGIKITVLNRSRSALCYTMRWINQAKQAISTYVDASMNFLPHAPSNSLYLLAPNAYWKSYIKDYFNDYLSNNISINKDKILEYIEKWCQMMATFDVFSLSRHTEMTCLDFIIKFHRYYYNNELEETTKKRLREAFPYLNDSRN